MKMYMEMNDMQQVPGGVETSYVAISIQLQYHYTLDMLHAGLIFTHDTVFVFCFTSFLIPYAVTPVL